jgi:ribosome-binding ATPase YchF (GTP1/OBG family)
MTTESEAYQIETFDATNNKIECRTITPLHPSQQRFNRPELATLPELEKQIAELTEDITAATNDFDTVSANLDEYYRPLKQAEQRVAELRLQLAEAESELAQLQAQGSPRDGFWNFINECECRVSGIARQLLDRFCQDAAINTFKVAFSRLSEHTQKDLALVYQMRLERFREGVYARLRRQEKATGEQVKSRASELLRDLQTIVTENFK